MLSSITHYVRALQAAAVTRFSNGSERGAVATEYAILIGFGVIIMAIGILAFGGDVSQWFTDLGNDLGGGADLPEVP